jgi:hypothetical protein
MKGHEMTDQPTPSKIPYQPQPGELSNFDISQIHCGLIIPNQESLRKMRLELFERTGHRPASMTASEMAQEIRMWRGEEFPDAI